MIKQSASKVQPNKQLIQVLGLSGLLTLLLLLPLGLMQSPSPALANHTPPTIEEFVETHPIGLAAFGDELMRISCADGYTATIYAEHLTSADGLAFGTDGNLYVVQESPGIVTQVANNGITTTVLTDLNSPEGITFDDAGTMYVVEDVASGRVISRSTSGMTGTVATGLENPEGIVWDSSTSRLYATESTVEAALAGPSQVPSDYRTHVTEVSLTGVKTRLFTQTASVIPGFPNISVTVWSYAGIDIGPDNTLYFTNEVAGNTTSGMQGAFIINVSTSGSIFTTTKSVATADDITFTSNLTSPEGLRFSAGQRFPLYVAEEDISGFITNTTSIGRLSRVAEDGTVSTFCTGFGGIEDVVLDDVGQIYVSEDSTGLIIKIMTSTIASNVFLDLTKSVDDSTPEAGQVVTYSIAVANSGTQTATNVLISDTLATELTYKGPLTLEPGGTPLPAPTLPTLAHDLTIAAGERITLTFPVTVSQAITTTLAITNTAAVTSTEVETPEQGSTTLTVGSGLTSTWLPTILKGS